MDVGFIGLGDQGAPMAEAIVEAGHALHVWARRSEVLAPFAVRGAIVHESPASLAGAVEVLGLCVVSEDDVRSVLFDQGALSACAPGTAVAIHSTIAPEGCERIALEAAEFGIHVIDAPVSGGRKGAQARSLLVMVGGADDVVERSMPVLESYAGTVAHVGPVGSGQVVKILNNLLMNANLTSSELVLSLGERLGIDRGRLRELMLAGSARNFCLEGLGTRPVFDKVRNAVGRKDLALAKQLVDRVGDPDLELLNTVAAIAIRVRDMMTAQGEI